MDFNKNAPAGANKVINIRHLFPVKYEPERVLGLAKVPSEGFMAPHFNKRRSLGDGLFCIRIYDGDGKPNAFMSGVISETKTGDPDEARKSYQTQLANALTVFYEGMARDEVKEPADICTLRQGHMSFMAVKCHDGIVAAGWYDTKSKTSTNGIHMLAFTLYTLGLLNLQDAVLKEATIVYLPFAEGIEGFNVEEVQRELTTLAMAFRPQRTQA
ncbi:MAG: hypothetical protein ACK5MU_02455 [Candidatus Saccharimonadales bacterium]